MQLKRCLTVPLMALAMYVVSPMAARAQDSHYWTLQYGPRSTLLGGAVVGSLLDLSSTYYNPGALGLIEDPSVVLSVYAFQHESLELKFEDGAREDLDSGRLGPSPGFVAGLLPSRWLPGLLGWSALTRADLDARTTERIDARQNGESVAAEFYFDQDMTEVWFGITWSLPVGSNWGVGATSYLAYRGQRTRLQTTVNAADSSGAGTAINVLDAFDYSTMRLVWKLGSAYTRGPMTAGLTLTTPSVPLSGSGTAAFERSRITTAASGSEVISRSENDLKAEYRSPLSIAVGAEYQFSETVLYATGEWFDDVPLYNVMQTNVAFGSRPGATLRRRMSSEHQSIANVAVGIEQQVTHRAIVSGSFATDFTAAVPQSETTHSLSDWDIYHVNVGTAVTVSGLEMTLGVGYAFGSDETTIPRDFEPDPNLLTEEPRLPAVRTEYSRWTLLLGFTFSI